MRPSATTPDSRAMGRARLADNDSLSVLYESHSQRVYRYLKRLVGDHDAEDLTQQVFLKLMTAGDRYRPREDVPFAAWLLRVSHNVAIDHLRTRRPIPTADLLPLTAASDDSGRDRLRSLCEALEELPRLQREVLVLRHIAGLGPGEIAIVLRRSEESVHGLHHRGRRALKQGLLRRQAAPSTLATHLSHAA
jgi:RNA polymerase sigma-70 factor (ECF subfamily)